VRRLAATAALLFTLCTSSCGHTSRDEFAFVSLAHEPTGKPVTIAYRFEPGEVVRMVVRADGALSASGGKEFRSAAATTLAMIFRCDEVRANGDAVLRVSFDTGEASADDKPRAPGEPSDAGGTLVIARDGVVKERHITVMGAGVAPEFVTLVNSSGFQPFVTLPPEGMRAGEALDLAAAMPIQAIADALRKAPGSAFVTPEARGEMVLMGTKVIDGEPCAEFALNLVLWADATQSARDIQVDLALRLHGTQFVSLRTGLAHGPAEVEVAMRSIVRGQGQSAFVRAASTVHVLATRPVQ